MTHFFALFGRFHARRIAQNTIGAMMPIARLANCSHLSMMKSVMVSCGIANNTKT